MSFPEKVLLEVRRSDEILDDEVVYLDARGMGFTSVHAVETTKGEIDNCLNMLQERYDQAPNLYNKWRNALRRNLLRQDRELCAIQDSQHNGYIVNDDTQMDFNTDVIVLHCSEVVAGLEQAIQLIINPNGATYIH